MPARPRVHLTAPVPHEVAAALERDFDLVDAPEGADGILVALTARVDEAYLDRAGPQLRVVANYAVGVNNIDLAAAAARGIVVTNTPDVLTRATAEFAIGLMLALLRRIAEGDRFIRRGSEWEFSLEFMLGSSLDGKELLVVGPGRIGRETARLAESFGARGSFAGRGDDLHALLGAADVVSLHVPLDDTTRIVSVGAGHEALLYWLANAAGYVLATDLYQGAWQSEGALEGDIRVLAHPEEFAPFEYRRDRLRFLQMNGTALGVRDASFDVAYSLSSIEHFGGVEGARAAVAEMGRVVRPDGIVVVATEQVVSGPPRDEVFSRDEIGRIFDVPGLTPVEPVDGDVWRRYETTPVDLVANPFETPHMLVRIEDTVFTSVLVFLRKT